MTGWFVPEPLAGCCIDREEVPVEICDKQATVVYDRRKFDKAQSMKDPLLRVRRSMMKIGIPMAASGVKSVHRPRHRYGSDGRCGGRGRRNVFLRGVARDLSGLEATVREPATDAKEDNNDDRSGDNSPPARLAVALLHGRTLQQGAAVLGGNGGEKAGDRCVLEREI